MILTVNLSGMDELAKAWYTIYRDRIGKEIIVAQASAASVTPTQTPPRDGGADGDRKPEVIEMPPPSI
jgi:hypothetical protein